MPSELTGGPIKGGDYIYIVAPSIRNKVLFCNEKPIRGKFPENAEFKEIEGPIKIGYTHDVYSRGSDYRSHGGILQDITFFQLVSKKYGHAGRIEKQIHKNLKEKHFHHEWFKINSDDAEIEVKKVLKEYGYATFASNSVGTWETFSRELNEEDFYVENNENYNNEGLKICLHSVSSCEKKKEEKENQDFILHSKLWERGGGFNLGDYGNKKLNYTKIFYGHNECLKYINSYYWKRQYPNEKQPSQIAWSEDDIN